MPPQLSYGEHQTISFGRDVTISDVDLDALNGGLGSYSTGALLWLQRSSGASLDDVFALDTSGASFTIVGNSLMNPLGHSFATFSTFGGKLIVTFSGPWATKALVNDVLRHISYTNTSDNPPEGAVDFRWEFFDGNIGAQGSGGELKAVATTQVQFRGVNDAPVNHVPGTQLADQAADLVFGTTHGNAITISDVDAGEGVIIVKLRVEHGTLTLGATDGLTSVTGNGGAVVELRGTLDDVNAALDGLTYRPTAGYAGSDTLRVFTDDVGNSGTGGTRATRTTSRSSSRRSAIRRSRSTTAPPRPKTRRSRSRSPPMTAIRTDCPGCWRSTGAASRPAARSMSRTAG